MCRWPAAAFRIARDQLLALDRLDQVGHRAGLERPVDLLVADIGRQHHEARVGELVADRLDGLRAVHARQPQVHQRHVRPLGPEERLRLLAGRGLGADRHVGLDRDDAGQAHADQIVIVDDHDLHDVPAMSSPPWPGRPVRGSRCAGTATVTARAAARRAVDRQHAAQFVDALADALQPEMMAGEILRALAHAAAVVLHHDRQAAVLEPQHDVDAPRARVLERVGDRLEPDAKQVVLVRGVEPRRRSLDAHGRAWRGCRASSAGPARRARRRGRGSRAPASGDPAPIAASLRGCSAASAARRRATAARAPARSAGVAATASSCSAIPASPCSSVSCSSRPTRVRSVSTA